MERLLQLFIYNEESGELVWKKRDISEFKDVRSFKIWNTRYAGKVAGCFDSNKAIVINLDGKNKFAHRLIWKMKTGEEPSHIDHKDLNPSNNRFENLRSANDSTNGWNVAGHKSTISGLKGVRYDKNLKNKPWCVSVMKNRKIYYGGYFASKEEAFKKACELREKLHGQFVRHGGFI